MDVRTFTLKSGREVSLDENERILLERMLDEDGTEHIMNFTLRGHGTRFCPRDQADSLNLKALVVYLHGEDITSPAQGAQLTDEGREVLKQISPSNNASSGLTALREGARQYEELTEGELMDLLSETVEVYADHLVGIPADMAKMVLALVARYDEAAPARARVGEYLRQLRLKHERNEVARSYTRARDEDVQPMPLDELASVREDMYADAATLRFGDLTALAPVAVRDSKAQFMAAQQRRLAYVLEHTPKLSDKQKEALEEIALGNVSWGSYNGLSCRGKRLDGRTVKSLTDRGLIGSLPGVGFARDGHYMIRRPQVEGLQG